MTVRTSKPALNLREKLSELDKPSGIAGQEILKANTSQEVFNYIGAGRRNLIINGAMTVSQRGDFTTDGTQSFSLNDYTVDRWKLNNNGAGTDYFQHITTNQPDGLYGSKSIKMTVKSTDARYRRLSQLVEDYEQFVAGRVMTVSFYYKAQNASGQLRVGQWSNNNFNELATLPSTDTWVRKEITFAVKHTATSSYRADIDFGFQTSAGASVAGVIGDYIEFTGVQLEVGSVATPFEHRSYGEELALCQRYCTKIGGDTNCELFGYCYNTTNSHVIFVPFPVTMRIKPAFSTYGNWIGYNSTNTADSAVTPIANVTTFNSASIVASNFTATQGTPSRINSTGSPDSGYFIFDAEL